MLFRAPIMTYLYFLIAAAFLARAGLFLFYGLVYRDRESDIPLAVVSTLLAFSFALYGVEHLWGCAVLLERILDIAICVLVVTSFVKSMLTEVKRGERSEKGRKNRGK